jgi:hypothetical protein
MIRCQIQLLNDHIQRKQEKQEEKRKKKKKQEQEPSRFLTTRPLELLHHLEDTADIPRWLPTNAKTQGS